MRESLTSPNDRLRTVAYRFFEHNPEARMCRLPTGAMEKEQAEFVRPALVRALRPSAPTRVCNRCLRERPGAARFLPQRGDRGARRLQGSIRLRRAYGHREAGRAAQDDAAVALGKIGDKRALETLAALQRSAPQARQPSVAAGICLLDVNCASHEPYLIETLKFSDRNAGFQDLLRAAAAGLGALGLWGRSTAVEALFEVGIPARDPARSPIALALAMVAMRNTALMMPYWRSIRPATRRSRSWRKDSTCSRRILRRSDSSRSRGAPTGRRPRRRQRAI
jgi:hypothetical protein